VKRSSPISTAQDLNGKTVAAGALNNLTHLGARAWVAANSGDSKSAHWLEIQISAMAAAVLSGRIDRRMVRDRGLGKTTPAPNLTNLRVAIPGKDSGGRPRRPDRRDRVAGRRQHHGGTIAATRRPNTK
jgi:hypothetical protein